MTVTNRHIAGVFDQIAVRLEIAGENPFRSRAYRKAAQEVLRCESRIASAVEAEEPLPELPGVGEALRIKIRTIVETGTVELLDRLRQQIPDSALELLRIRGLGPAKVRLLLEDSGIATVDKLKQVIEEEGARSLKGLGERTADRVRRSLGEYLKHRGRTLRVEAVRVVEPLLARMEGTGLFDTVLPAGSLRRGAETVRNIDLVAVAPDPQAALDAVLALEEVEQVLRRTEAAVSFRPSSGPTVDIYMVPPSSLGAALHLLTGSRAHCAALAETVARQGLRFEGFSLVGPNGPVDTPTEAACYQTLGLPPPPPELREGAGEVEAAREGRLPDLLTTDDVRGDLHMHTPYSDGRDPLGAMVRVAREMGYQYLAFTDHTRNVAIANGMDAERTSRYLDDIEALAARLEGIALLKGIEVDILKHGNLDLPDELLKRMDVVIASVHSHFDLPEEEMTERVKRALDNRYVNVLAHPTCRLIGSRSPLPLNVEEVIEHAAVTGTMLELNSNPERLDLNARYCRLAAAAGVPVVISTDAHSVKQLANIQYGVTQARRGWLEPRNVANTLPLEELRKLLYRKR